jgi:hypothetical protein
MKRNCPWVNTQKGYSLSSWHRGAAQKLTAEEKDVAEITKRTGFD